MKRKIIFILIIFLLFISGCSFIQENDLGQQVLSIQPVDKIELRKGELEVKYTDKIDNEDIIIKSNNRVYYGLKNASVFFSVTNLKQNDKGKIIFDFKDKRIKLKNVYRYEPTISYIKKEEISYIPYDCQVISSTTKELVDNICYKQATTTKTYKKINEKWTELPITNNTIDVIFPTRTIFYKAIIEFPFKSEGEFVIKAISKDNNFKGELDPWYNSNWSYRKKITIDNTKVSATLSDFPVYLDLSQLGTDFWSNVQSDCDDIRITTSDETTEVPREIVYCDSANSKGEVWFKAPSLSGSTDTDFYIYYGNASASDYADSDTYGANNVWNSDYKLVAHLEESGNGTSGEYKDKTSNANHGTGDAAPTRSSTTKLGGYTQSFNDSNTAIDFPDSLANGWTEFTFSCWFKCPSGSADNNTFFSRMISESPRNWVRAKIQTTGVIDFQPAKDNTYKYIVTTNTYDDNNWHYVTFVFDGNSSTIKIYVDGSQQASGTGYSSLASGTPTNHFSVGMNATNTWLYNGLLDEVRVAEAVLSADWIATEYNNQNSPSTFYTIGAQESTSSGGITTVIIINN